MGIVKALWGESFLETSVSVSLLKRQEIQEQAHWGRKEPILAKAYVPFLFKMMKRGFKKF